MRERIKSVRLGRWTVTLYATERTDARGCTGLGWTVREDGKSVARDDGSDLVFGSPLHADDSDETMAAACSLISHCATHDSDDARVECAWDADGMGEAAAMRYCDMA